MKLLGLTGMPKAGKGEAVSALVHDGWTPISMSAVLREMIFQDPAKHFKNKDAITRNDLFEGAIEYRRIYGKGCIAEQCLKMIEQLPAKHRKKVVIDGIRHPAEIQAILKADPGSHFLGIVADEDPDRDFEIRWRRFHNNMGQRGPHFEGHSKGKFKMQDDIEWDNPGSEYGSKIGACLNEVAQMKQTGHGTIMVNGLGDTREEWGERVREFALTLEGKSRNRERGN